jgi:hypothetical protein
MLPAFEYKVILGRRDATSRLLAQKTPSKGNVLSLVATNISYPPSRQPSLVKKFAPLD